MTQQTSSRPANSADLIRIIRLYRGMCERLRIQEPLSRESVDELLEDVDRMAAKAGRTSTGYRLYDNLRRYIRSKRP
jgi:hypothetical protein